MKSLNTLTMVRVLMFHRVLPEKQITHPNAYSTFGTLISQEFFESVLSCLSDNGFQFVTVSELTRRTSTDKLVALTFDDGYFDNYEFALPSLLKFNVTATFFPVVNPCKENTVLPLDIYYQCIDEMKMSENERKEYITGTTKRNFYWAKPDEQLNMLDSLFNSLPQKSKVRYMRYFLKNKTFISLFFCFSEKKTSDDSLYRSLSCIPDLSGIFFVVSSNPSEKNNWTGEKNEKTNFQI